MNVTEKLQFIDPTSGHSHLVSSSGVILSLQQEKVLSILTNKLTFFMTRLVKMVDLREKLTSYIRSYTQSSMEATKTFESNRIG